MKVALVHDFLREYGGAERVLEALHELWPEAPVYTSYYLPKKMPEHFQQWDIRTGLMNNWSLLGALSKSLSFLLPFVFASFDFSGYDVVISSSASFAKGIKVKKPTVHINYCHTPPRFLYHLPSETNREKWWLLKPVLAVVDLWLRVWDFNAAQKVDYFIANSKTVQRRIEKFYRRESTVIYPPVNVDDRFDGVAKGSYFLVISRLSRYKNIDIIIKACGKLQLPLKIIGTGREENRLKQLAGPTVEFLGFVSEQEKWYYLNNCQALIFAASDEDFGIVPVEAMAAGKPVIALRQGGVVETVVEGKTGVFFDSPTTSSLAAVLKNFQAERYDPKDCHKRAEQFSKERFMKEMRAFVISKLSVSLRD